MGVFYNPPTGGEGYLKTVFVESSKNSVTVFLVFVWLFLTHPTPGIEAGGRMRCAVSSMSSVSATLETLTHADKSHNLTGSHSRECSSGYILIGKLNHIGIRGQISVWFKSYWNQGVKFLVGSKHIGIRGQILGWFKAYLPNRTNMFTQTTYLPFKNK